MEYFKNQHLKQVIAFMLLSLGLLISSCGSKTEKGNEQGAVEAPGVGIHEAVFMGNTDAVKQHIAAKSDLNEKDAYGSSPLAVASTFGKTEIAKLLIEGGADLNVTSADGSTPLHTAAFFGRTEIVKSLLEKGIDVNVRNGFGSTALESVTAPFEQVRSIYDDLAKNLGPLGLRLDYDKLVVEREAIAKLIRNHRQNG